MARDAFHGLAGEIVRAIEPHTEAEPAAVLIQLLAAVGNAAGSAVRVRVEADEHPARVWPLLVGDTSAAKGTSWGRVRQVLALADPEWARECATGGLVSGEGLIHDVRDAVRRRPRGKEQAEPDGLITEDAGIEDKRRLYVEPEFARVLKAAERSGNTLSPLLRQAWDTGELRVAAKTAGERATGAHVTVVGHITTAELRRTLTETETANGFANRFVLVACRRVRDLPFGGNLDPSALRALADRLGEALSAARARTRPVVWDDPAKRLWEENYPRLRARPPGLLGAATGRAAANTLRLAVTYALLDRSDALLVEHVAAALAVWAYCEQTAALVFGDRLGDALADRILAALRDAGPGGLTRTELRDSLGRHAAGAAIDAALANLRDLGLADCQDEPSGGRPVQRWRACDQSDESDQSPAAEHLSSLPSLSSQPETAAIGAPSKATAPASIDGAGDLHDGAFIAACERMVAASAAEWLDPREQLDCIVWDFAHSGSAP
jgi:hypothetical protein